MASPMIALKGPLMNKKDYSSNFPLKHAQKDMRFALGLGDKVRCRLRRDTYEAGRFRYIDRRPSGRFELLSCRAGRGCSLGLLTGSVLKNSWPRAVHVTRDECNTDSSSLL